MKTPRGVAHGIDPPKILALGFLGLIAVGTLLLSLPLATEAGEPLPFIDALFTATSAVAVTGLTVVHTADTFSTFGELVILVLIQVGGLGFMTMSTLAALVLGRKITLRERLVLQQALGQTRLEGIIRLTKAVLQFTFAIEAAGAVLLALRWGPELGWGKAIYYGIFHAISAFCNAGFDLLANSLTGYRGDGVVTLVVAGLFILGGLGFGVLVEIYRRPAWSKVSLQTKLVLCTTGILVAAGFLGVLGLEYRNPATLGSIPGEEKILAAFFQGVTPRTAGFSTLNIGELQPATLFFLMMLMFIGASSGSTGGGIKTNTFATIALSLYTMLLGKEETRAFGRRISPSIIFKAFAVAIMSLSVITIATLVLLGVEKAGFEQIFFEVFSAFGTVGLSTGITAGLSTTSKLVLSATMFIGRVGPLTLGFALARRGQQARDALHYPEEPIMVG